MYDDILLPVAPNGKANDAVPHAESLGERYDATVHVVSAIDTVAQSMRGPQAGAFAERVESAAERRVEAVTADLESAGVDVVGNVVRGGAVDVIENAIDGVGADIVVMPSHARSGLRRVLLGSVTEKVVRVSSVPVVTVPMADREGEAEAVGAGDHTGDGTGDETSDGTGDDAGADTGTDAK